MKMIILLTIGFFPLHTWAVAAQSPSVSSSVKHYMESYIMPCKPSGPGLRMPAEEIAMINFITEEVNKLPAEKVKKLLQLFQIYTPVIFDTNEAFPTEQVKEYLGVLISSAGTDCGNKDAATLMLLLAAVQ